MAQTNKLTRHGPMHCNAKVILTPTNQRPSRPQMARIHWRLVIEEFSWRLWNVRMRKWKGWESVFTQSKQMLGLQVRMRKRVYVTISKRIFQFSTNNFSSIFLFLMENFEQKYLLVKMCWKWLRKLFSLPPSMECGLRRNRQDDNDYFRIAIIIIGLENAVDGEQQKVNSLRSTSIITVATRKIDPPLPPPPPTPSWPTPWPEHGGGTAQLTTSNANTAATPSNPTHTQ